MKNYHCLEVSIVERCVTEEDIDFCSNNFSKTWSIGNRKYRHNGIYEAKGTQGLNIKTMTQDVVLQAHMYILNNFDEVQL